MLEALKEKNRLNETVFLAILAMLSFSFSVFRYLYSDTEAFLFLNWNLFLAFVPWALTSLVIIKPHFFRKKFFIFIIMIFWLLFFPNSPYILTDLFHLNIDAEMPVWFDLVLILSFAWTGLLFGFLSLRDIEVMLNKSIKRMWAVLIVGFLLFLGSLGVYMGRYLRWNSWELLTEPYEIFYDVGNRLINPFEHPRTWGMTIFLGVFLNMMYWSFRVVICKNPKQ